MPDIPGTTRAQTKFLRAFRKSPTGPAPNDWPSPPILRRWLGQPAFRDALQSIKTAINLQADFRLTAAATHAAQSFCNFQSPATTQNLCELVRLARRRHYPLAKSTAHYADPGHLLAIAEQSRRLTAHQADR